MKIRFLENLRQNRVHNARITEPDRIKTADNKEFNSSRRFRSVGTGTIMRPIGFVASSIDQCKFKVTLSLENNIADRDPPLIMQKRILLLRNGSHRKSRDRNDHNYQSSRVANELRTEKSR